MSIYFPIYLFLDLFIYMLYYLIKNKNYVYWYDHFLILIIYVIYLCQIFIVCLLDFLYNIFLLLLLKHFYFYLSLSASARALLMGLSK